MFFHKQELQFKSSPTKPDPVYAKRMQEILGGQYGEITVAMQYGFQAWNSHLPGKYRDLLFSIGAEEFGHVEMIATMIAQLLETAPVEQSEAAMKADLVPWPAPTQPDERFYGTTPRPNVVEKAAGAVKDKLTKK